MAKRVKFDGAKKSKADHANPFFDVMSPAERKFAAKGLRKAGYGGKKRGGKAGGGS